MPATLDLAAIRARFPALSRRDGGRVVLYLDGPGGSQVPREVIDAMAGYLEERNANLGGAFRASRESDGVLERARRAAADLVGGEAEEIAFGANMTSLNFALAHAVARTLEPGDELVVTTLDHDANMSPWLLVAADHDLTVRQVGIAPDTTIDLEELQAVVGERTRVVAFSLASNALGTISDAARIVEIAHAAGALAWADAVHYAPHRRIDVAALGVDVLLCSPYKFFGPHLGIAWARRELLERWPADRVRPADEHPPGHRFETGTLSHEAIAGLIAAVGYLESLADGVDRRERLDAAFALIADHEATLARRFLEGIASVSGLRLYGIADPERCDERTPTFAFTLEGQHPRAVAEALAREAIAVWDGNYYALALMQQLGLEQTGGAVRAGFLHYSTSEEVDRLLGALRRLCKAA